MRAAVSIPLGAAGLERSAVDPVRLIGRMLTLLFDRYEWSSTIRYRCSDGSLVSHRSVGAADHSPLGALLELDDPPDDLPLEGVTASVQLPAHTRPVTLSFAGMRTNAFLEVAIEASNLPASAGIDPQAILSHMDVLLRVATERPSQLFGTVDILTERERAWLVETAQGREVPYPDTTLHAMFMAQARRMPDAVALVEDDRHVTYRELDARSNKVAQQLRAYVSEAGQVIAVSGRRSIEILTVKIGVMKAGAAFLYLSPDMPPNRVRLICTIATPIVVVASRDAPVATGSIRQLGLESLLASDAPDEPLQEIADASTAAYILFTSGSTGEPKGVVRPHRMNTTRILLEQTRYGLGARHRHLMKSVPFFREFFWALATGGTVVIARPGGELDDSYLISLIRQHGISVCSFVPSMLRILLANPSFRTPDLPIEHLFVAGEVLDVGLESSLRERGFAVHVTYTLAEADYVSHRSDAPAATTTAIDVGRPIDMQVYVCDQQGRLMPPGFAGELLAGGPGLSDGYVNRPDLTAERFIANPFDPKWVPRLFRTGDLGRVLPSGHVEFLGRIDGQVKIRGQRVEPTEVERVLRCHGSVENAVVASLPDRDQGHVLVAFIKMKRGTLDTAAMRDFLLDDLPAYMVPSYLVQVADLPLLGSGKVDRATFRVVLSRRPVGLGPATPPDDALEERIAATWSRVLGIEEIGVDDLFTALGGDSLRVMVLRLALEADLGMAIDLALLVQCPSVRALADRLRVPV